MKACTLRAIVWLPCVLATTACTGLQGECTYDTDCQEFCHVCDKEYRRCVADPKCRDVQKGICRDSHDCAIGPVIKANIFLEECAMEKFLYVFGIALVLSGCADYQSSFPGSDSGSWFDPNDRCWIPGPCAATVLPATDGYYTEYSYDDDGFLVSQQVYDDYRPKVLTTYQYNHSGQLEVVTEQWTGSEAWRTVYIYGGGGQLIREENRDSTGWLSERITYRYDENSRLAQKVHEFDSPNVKQWIDFSYDEQGNLLLEEQTYESIFGVRLKCTHHSRDESGHATTVATDEECDGVFEKAIRTSTDENGCVVLREEFEGLDRLDRFTQTACDSCGKRLWSTSYQVEAEGPVEYETETFEYGCWE